MAFLNGLLREKQLTIDQQFKFAACGWGELPIGNEVLYLTFAQNFVRQTDGPWGVVSSSAVNQFDVNATWLHREGPPKLCSFYYQCNVWPYWKSTIASYVRSALAILPLQTHLI